MSNNIKELLKTFEEVNKELNAQIAANGKEFIKSVFQEIFDQHKGLKLIKIIGWTPGFNDGEPCTHSQETVVGKSHTWTYRGDPHISYDFGDREMYEEFDVEFAEDGDTVLSHINSDCETLDAVASQVVVYEELVERVFDTNFDIEFRLEEDGSVSVSVDDYDCGY